MTRVIKVWLWFIVSMVYIWWSSFGIFIFAFDINFDLSIDSNLFIQSFVHIFSSLQCPCHIYLFHRLYDNIYSHIRPSLICHSTIFNYIYTHISHTCMLPSINSCSVFTACVCVCVFNIVNERAVCTHKMKSLWKGPCGKRIYLWRVTFL